ncbi:uncharacterized protein N7459_006461 [Penicillium hispanicum]|uniref:uncharacterized protein n=1 Tax=Penicillium hispanicum TaxID=1080232 RepID=UPI00253F7A5F|nr:uncharacterized protein N7459_006461 [Penicillium hispanicum]KAJ5577497.1 hypothetical protein N7459_006461 [Penicillium hispanicum]
MPPEPMGIGPLRGAEKAMIDPEQTGASLFALSSSHSALGIALLVFMSIILAHAIELTIVIPLGSRRYRNLYFWALSTSSSLITAT